MAEVDFSKKFLKPGEVERVLRRTRWQIDALVKERRLTKHRQGSQWRFLTSEVRALAKALGLTAEGALSNAGAIEATAIAMMRDGATDGEIVHRLELPLDTVERLRLSLGLPSTAEQARSSSGRAALDDEQDREHRPSVAKTRLAEARARSLERLEASRRRFHLGGNRQ